MSENIWIGPLTQFETEGSPHWENTREKQQATLTYSGPYNVLVANMPLWGQTLAGFSPALTVEKSDCVLQSGGSGLLTIIISQSLGSTRYRRGRVEIQKRLETHPRYIATAGQPGAYWSNSKEMMMWLAQALNDEQAATPQDEYADGTANPFWDTFHATYPNTPASTGNAGDKTWKPTYYLALVLGQPGLLELYNKIKSGEDSYAIGVPTVEEETVNGSDPGSQSIYTLEAPPSGSNYPSGYVWMKTADEAEQVGNQNAWMRRRKWMGFDRVDVEVYD